MGLAWPRIYFWEDNPYRALDYAIDCARKKQKFSGDIKNPLVPGAMIELGNCLNLIEPNPIDIIKRAYTRLQNALKVSGEPMPSNKGANRSRDCAVIGHLHQNNIIYRLPPYDTIRSPFHEGAPIYDQANFTSGLHIEICVTNPDQIKGYFLPHSLEKFNPYLHKEFSPSR